MAVPRKAVVVELLHVLNFITIFLSHNRISLRHIDLTKIDKRIYMQKMIKEVIIKVLLYLCILFFFLEVRSATLTIFFITNSRCY